MSDYVLKARQIMEFPLKGEASSADAVLLQTGGLGGPYAYTTAYGLVVGALDFPGSQIGVGIPLPGDAIDTGVVATHLLMPLGCTFGWNWYSTAAGNATLGPGSAAVICYDGANFTFGVGDPDAFDTVMVLANSGDMLLEGTLTVSRNPVNGFDVATKNYVDGLIDAIINNSVWSWNGRRGNVSLLLSDITGAGGAPINSPSFLGTPLAPTPPFGDASSRLATTAFVQAGLNELESDILSDVVLTFNGRKGNVHLIWDDVEDVGGAPLHSPHFTGTPRAPTPPDNDVSDRIATTEWVREAIFDEDQGLIVELQVSVSASPPPNPRRGKLWWDLSKGPSGGALYVWVVDTDSAQWVVANRAEPGPPGRPGLAHDIPHATVLGNISGHEDEPRPLNREELTDLLDSEVLTRKVDLFTREERGAVPPPDDINPGDLRYWTLCADGEWRHLLMPDLDEFPSDYAAGQGGVPVGGLYHNGGVVRVRLP
jgi:hypothetical protein